MCENLVNPQFSGREIIEKVANLTVLSVISSHMIFQLISDLCKTHNNGVWVYN